MKKTILIGFGILAALNSSADVKVSFENSEGYQNIGIYDVWEESPFRNGQLEGKYVIVANPDKHLDSSGEVANPSSKVLAAERSRFGSNRFGVRVDLNEPISLSPDTLFVHVLLHKPKDGRVMLVGLGSRKERLGQNPYTEQFHVLSSAPVKPGEWNDAVFPIRGAEGIEIRSLVLVPDCESPHDLKEDFLFYVDDLEINRSAEPRIKVSYNPIFENSEKKDADKVILNDNQLNGEVVAADGRKLNSLEAPSGKPFKIKVLPEKGFHNGGVEIRSEVRTVFVSPEKFDSDGCYEIPGYLLKGDVLICGKMLEDK